MADLDLNISLQPGARAAEVSGSALPITIDAIGPDIVRISFGGAASASSPSYLPGRPPARDISLSGGGTETSIGTGALSLDLDADLGQLRLLDASGAPRLRIEVRAIAQSPRWRIRFINVGEQHFYGLGHGGLPLDRLGTTRRLWNSHINHGAGGDIPIPLLFSHLGYGLFFDNPRFASIDSGKSHNHICFDYECDPGAFDLYYIGGGSFRESLTLATGLIGRAPMPPRWALGYLQSSRHFDGPEEVLGIGKSLREKQLPSDGVIFLSTYKDGKGWNKAVGRLDYDDTAFPNGAEMVAQLRRDNLRVITHEYPVVHPEAAQWAEAQAKGYVIDDGYPVVTPKTRPSTSYFEGQRMIDFENDAASRWWWEAHRDLVAEGVEGWWLDGGEGPTSPAVLARPGGDALHNRFDLFRQAAFAAGEARDNPDRRPYLLCRSGGTGMQRHGAGLWSGDINNTWAVLEAQSTFGLSVGLSGVPLWGTDIGGFYPTAPQTGELFARWLQFGAFNPVFRGHGVLWRKHTPYAYGEDIEAICRATLELRYSLMPYTYTLARQAHETGLPYMRALVVNYAGDPQARDRAAEFLWGDDILVAPVTRAGATHWPVYLPIGTDWFDYWTGERHAGGQFVSVASPLDRIPMFARAGAIIPIGPVVQHLTGYAPENVTLLAYPGEGESEFTLYEDDGETNAYRSGTYAKTRFSLSSGVFKIEGEEGDAGVLPAGRRYTLKLWSDADPRSVTGEKGDPLRWLREGPHVVVALGAGPGEARFAW